MTSGANNRIFMYSSTIVLHVVNGAVMAWSLHYGKAMQNPDPDLQLFRTMTYRFITIWNLIFQLQYALLSLGCELYDVMEFKILKKYRDIAEHVRNRFFCGVVWPITVGIFCVFWPLYIYDRELLFPSYYDKVLSQWSNHVMHTCILFIVLWELAEHPRQPAKAHWQNLKWTSLVYGIYVVSLYVTDWQFGAFPYPILKMFSELQLAIFLTFIYLLAVFSYSLQWVLTPLLKNLAENRAKKSM